jgi:hypothetical protein
MYTKRKVTLDEIYADQSDRVFEEILLELKSGSLQSAAHSIDLVEGEDCRRTSNAKHPLTTEEWDAFTLRLDTDNGVHLVDNEGCQARTKIALNSSEVNRLLGFTSQAGGVQSKMGPKVYAYLAAGYAHNEIKLSADPNDLFTELEERPELWDERGPIDQVRGISAVRGFLKFLKHIDQQLADGRSINDISFASDD